MADETGPALGMSIGASTLTAVTADRAVTRTPVLTLYPGYPSQVGLPAENSESLEPAPAEPGLVLTDFVDRVGGSDPVVALDGSARPAEQVLADGLHALAYLATDGGRLPPAVAVAHPAHWSAEAVAALRSALGRVPQWAKRPVSLVSSVSATLTALQSNPGLPSSGIIAVCDIGGTGGDITLVDAGADYRPVGATVRHTGFCGEVIDQLLLDHVVTELGANGPDDGVPAVGSLARLRGQCSAVKERLSIETVAELPGFYGGVWITRAELDDAIRPSLDGFIAALRNTLADNRIPADRLVAVVTAGGVANVPALDAGLADAFGVPVISAARSELTAAIGAALGVAGAAGVAEPAPQPVAPASTPPQSDVEPVVAAEAPAPSPAKTLTLPDVLVEPATPTGTIPQRALEGADRAAGLWLRRPVPVIMVAALAALLLGTVAVIALRHAAVDREPESPLMTTQPTSTTPARRLTPPVRPGHAPVFPEVPTMVPGPETAAPAPEAPEAPEAPAAPPEPEAPAAPPVSEAPAVAPAPTAETITP